MHDGPSEERLNAVRLFLGELGLQLGGGDNPTSADYQELLNSIKDRSDANVIQTVMLRSLSQAVYSPEEGGHFGLGYAGYAHFTSPIRRYPDLINHRAIKSVIHGVKLPRMWFRLRNRIRSLPNIPMIWPGWSSWVSIHPWRSGVPTMPPGMLWPG